MLDRAHKNPVAEYPPECLLQGGISGPGGVIRPVAQEKDGFLRVGADDRLQATADTEQVGRYRQQRQADRGAYLFVPDLLKKTNKFMAADEVNGLNHRPSVPPGMQLPKDFMGMLDGLVLFPLH